MNDVLIENSEIGEESPEGPAIGKTLSMKHFFTLLFSLFLSTLAFGQQPSQYSLYMLNKMNFNPGYAGLDHSLSFTGVFRKQWVDLPESPTTQNMTVHMPLYIAKHFTTHVCR